MDVILKPLHEVVVTGLMKEAIDHDLVKFFSVPKITIASTRDAYTNFLLFEDRHFSNEDYLMAVAHEADEHFKKCDCGVRNESQTGVSIVQIRLKPRTEGRVLLAATREEHKSYSIEAKGQIAQELYMTHVAALNIDKQDLWEASMEERIEIIRKQGCNVVL